MNLNGAKSLLVKLFGVRAMLFHWDTMVLDRWLWLKKRLPQVLGGKRLLDVGCGNGSFTLCAAKRGYETIGLSWDEGNSLKAQARAKSTARFEVMDIRSLDKKTQFQNSFDYAICLEAIEHIVDDFKLMRDMSSCLKPGGRLLMTTPFYHFRAMTAKDKGAADLTIEDGGHVRRGYTRAMLLELCQSAGLVCEEITFCSGLLSQKATQLLREAAKIHHLFGWALILPLRFLVPLVDRFLTPLLGWPYYSICLEAYKPRLANSAPSIRLQRPSSVPSHSANGENILNEVLN